MTKPIESVSPEPSRGGGSIKEGVKAAAEKFNEAMKKVEGVPNVEESEFEKPDKRPFYQQITEEDEETSSSAQVAASSPSSSAASSVISSSGIEDPGSIPTPGAPAPEGSSSGTGGLPESKNFWQNESLSTESPTSQQLQQTPGKTQKKANELEAEKKKGLPGMIGNPHIKKEKEQKKETGVPWQPAPQMPLAGSKPMETHPSKGRVEKSTVHVTSETHLGEKQQKKPTPFEHSVKRELREKKERSVAGQEGSRLTVPLHQTEEREERREHKHDLHGRDAVVPDPLPPTIQTTTAAIQITAAPYLSPQTAALFSKLIGTLLFMVSATPGITRTEITLNSEPFRNSTFYNSTVVLERYATAPDSFNIRLAGTPEAVKLFQENSQLLLGAFSTAYVERRVPFRIGRLETSIERHLIRRKQEREEGFPQ